MNLEMSNPTHRPTAMPPWLGPVSDATVIAQVEEALAEREAAKASLVKDLERTCAQAERARFDLNAHGGNASFGLAIKTLTTEITRVEAEIEYLRRALNGFAAS